MMNQTNDGTSQRIADVTASRCIDWYSEGQTRVVEVDGVRIEVHVIGRKGRRTRIEIVAPAGAVFRSKVVPEVEITRNA